MSQSCKNEIHDVHNIYILIHDVCVYVCVHQIGSKMYHLCTNHELSRAICSTPRKRSTQIHARQYFHSHIHLSQTYTQVIKANPTAKFGEIAKIIGAQWRKLTDAQKKPYTDKEKAGKAEKAPAK